MQFTLAHSFNICVRHIWQCVLAAGLLTAAATSQAAVAVNLKFALRGAALSSGGNFPMTTDLVSASLIPLTDPYGGTVTALALTANTVDWVLVELLSGASAATCNTVRARPALLLSDGSIVDPTTLAAPLNFATVAPGSYNIRIRHRNHAALISTAQTLGTVAGAAVNFTLAGTVVNPGNAATAALGLVAQVGDVNQDGAINGNPVATPPAGTDMALVRTDFFNSVFGAYVATDLNLDSIVDGLDYNLMSVGLSSGDVPVPFAFPTSGGIAVCGAGVLAVAGTTAIPVLSPGMLVALSGLLALTAAGLRRRR